MASAYPTANRIHGKTARRLLLMVTFLLGTSMGCGSSNSPATQEKLQFVVDANWIAYKEQYSIPSGGLAVYFETPSGAYFASSGMPPGVDQNTHFRVASNTKTFTAAAIMLLYEQGKLQLDDTIVSNIPGTTTTYVPDTTAYNIPYKNSITIRQLLGHLAGVFDVTNNPIPDTCAAPYAGKLYLNYVRYELGDDNHQFTFDELVGVVANCQLSHYPPGVNYKYSNTGYSLLGKIIERVSGLSYDQFIIQNLIVPNSLSATSVPVLGTDTSIPSPYVDGYSFDQGTLTNWTIDNMSGNNAEGNIISTQADLALWVKRLLTGNAGISPVGVNMMKTLSAASGYTCGLGITYEKGLGYGKDGAHNGFLSLMLYDPDDDVTMVIYFNILDYNITAQAALMTKVAREAKHTLGY